MKFIALLFCFITVIGFTQKDTCIWKETDYYTGTSMACGTLDRKGRWHGKYSFETGHGRHERSYSKCEYRMKHGIRTGKELCYRKKAGTYEFVLTEENNYRNNLEHGKFKKWYDGKLFQTGRHRKGITRGTWIMYDTLGNVAKKTVYGFRHSYIEEHFLDGILHYRAILDRSKKKRDYRRIETYFDLEGNEITFAEYRKIWFNKLRNK